MLSKVTSFLNAVLVSNHRVRGKVMKDVEYLKSFSSHYFLMDFTFRLTLLPAHHLQYIF